MHLAHQGHHLVDAGAEIDLAAGAELAQVADDAFQDVGERQVGQRPVGRVTRKAAQRRVRGPGQVPVTQDRRLGRAGGAGGVDQAGHILRLHRLPAAGQQARTAAAELVASPERVFPADHPAFDLGGLTVDQDDPFEVRQLRPHRGDLVEERALFDDQHLRLGMREQVLHLFGCQCRIDGDRDRAGMHDAEVRDLPLRTVGRPQRDPILRLQAFAQQRVGEPRDRTRVLRPADPDPALAGLEKEGGCVGSSSRRLLEERRNRFRQRGRGIQGWLVQPHSRFHAATIREFRYAIRIRPAVTYPYLVVVGTCELDFHLPENHSLKGKRQVSRSIAQRIRNRFNVSVAEVAALDRWQVLSLGVTCATNDRRHANEILSKIVHFAEDQTDGAILQHSRIEIVST